MRGKPASNDNPPHIMNRLLGKDIIPKVALRVIWFLLLLTASSSRAAATSEDRPQTIPQLQAAIETVLKETRTPGAAIAIVSRDQADWVAGIGKADVVTGQLSKYEKFMKP